MNYLHEYITNIVKSRVSLFPVLEDDGGMVQALARKSRWVKNVTSYLIQKTFRCSGRSTRRCRCW